MSDQQGPESLSDRQDQSYSRGMDASDAIVMWLDEGLVDDELAARLRASLEERDEPERANRLIWLLVSVGAVLIGGGLLLFIASQWDHSSPIRRLGLLFGIYVIIVAGAGVAQRQQLDITARGLWFLSSIAVGVNLFLVGQIFNLTLNYWQGTLLWLIATLAMGWASPSSAQGWLAVPLGLLTLGWISVPSSRFFDQGAFLWEPAGLRPLLPLVGLALVGIGLLVAPTSFSWLTRPAAAFGALSVAVPVTVSTFHPEAFGWIFGIEFRPFPRHRGPPLRRPHRARLVEAAAHPAGDRLRSGRGATGGAATPGRRSGVR